MAGVATWSLVVLALALGDGSAVPDTAAATVKVTVGDVGPDPQIDERPRKVSSSDAPIPSPAPVPVEQVVPPAPAPAPVVPAPSTLPIVPGPLSGPLRGVGESKPARSASPPSAAPESESTEPPASIEPQKTPKAAPARAAKPSAVVPGTGLASWYGGKFHGRKTACGEIFDQEALTVAHKTMPFGTLLALTNPENGCRVTVRVTDRGPYVGKRVIDCSRGVAEELGFLDDGVAHLCWEVVDPADLLPAGDAPDAADADPEEDAS